MGKWRYVNSRSWVSTDSGLEFVTHYNTKNDLSIEFVKGNFVLVEDQLTYNGQMYKVEFHHNTLVLLLAQSEETYVRWEE